MKIYKIVTENSLFDYKFLTILREGPLDPQVLLKGGSTKDYITELYRTCYIVFGSTLDPLFMWTHFYVSELCNQNS